MCILLLKCVLHMPAYKVFVLYIDICQMRKNTFSRLFYPSLLFSKKIKLNSWRILIHKFGLSIRDVNVGSTYLHSFISERGLHLPTEKIKLLIKLSIYLEVFFNDTKCIFAS